jgi:hypothetical protein
VLKDGYLSDFVKTAKQMKANLEGMVAAGGGQSFVVWHSQSRNFTFSFDNER